MTAYPVCRCTKKRKPVEVTVDVIHEGRVTETDSYHICDYCGLYIKETP